MIDSVVHSDGYSFQGVPSLHLQPMGDGLCVRFGDIGTIPIFQAFVVYPVPTGNCKEYLFQCLFHNRVGRKCFTTGIGMMSSPPMMNTYIIFYFHDKENADISQPILFGVFPNLP